MPAGLKSYQRVILPSTLYAVNAAAAMGSTTSSNSAEQLAPNIQVAGNAGDVYGSQALPDSAPAGMTKLFDALLNIAVFTIIPNYLYVDPTGSDPDAIILTGVNAEAV